MYMQACVLLREESLSWVVRDRSKAKIKTQILDSQREQLTIIHTPVLSLRSADP